MQQTNSPRPPGPRPDRPGWPVRLFARAVAGLYLRRPELAEAIALRYRSPRSIAAGILNELAYRMGVERAPFLLSANIELTNRCNLHCSICPTGNGSMRRPRGVMDSFLFRRALAGAGRLEYVLLFQWGEPLLHPAFGSLIREAASTGARTFVTTNGTLLDERRTRVLLESGVARVTISVDGDRETHERVRGIPLARTEAAIRRLVAERDAMGADTAVDVSMVVGPETESASLSFRRLFAGQVDRVQLIPQLTRGERRTRCREPWRGGLVVLQDGRVTACCVDHEGELALGDARREDLRHVWNGRRMRALRRAHVQGRLPPLCARCSEYPTDAAAPRFSRREEASRLVPHPGVERATG